MDIELKYSPYPHQQEVHDANTRVKAVMWPIRSGKDYMSCPEALRETISRMPEWSARTDMTPRWHIWCIGPTFPLTRQLWRDVKRIWPTELMAKPPMENSLSIQLINDGLLEMKSADDPDRLVASAIDFVIGTECGLWKREVWSMSVRGRMSSPGRFGKAILNGTPQGQMDKYDPTLLHWWYEMILQGKNMENWDYLKSFYWFDDKFKYDYLDHPILSLSARGNKELELIRTDPNISERDYRQNFLGECLPTVSGHPVTPMFDMALHVADFKHVPDWPTYVSLDFGRHYPVATISQFSPDNIWYVLAEFAPIQQDLTDEDFIELLTLYLEEVAPTFPTKRRWFGDYEANQKQDARYMSTSQMMSAKFNIDLISRPTKKGDEPHAINVLNGRLKTRQDGKTGIVIHPRCINTIKCFQGGWHFKRGHSADYTWIDERVAEVHPFIDFFDSYKYLIMHVIRPEEAIRNSYMRNRRRSGDYNIIVDKDSGIPLRRD